MDQLLYCQVSWHPKFFIFTSQASSLLYYSHLPAVIISLLLGFFVYFKNRTFVSKILLFISSIFSTWALLNLVIWVGDDSRIMMFGWSFFGVLYSLIYIASLYFVYVFIDKKDISLTKKVILGLLFLPVVLLIPTQYNLEGFDLINCEAQEGQYYTFYYYFLGFFISLWILVLSFVRYRKAEPEFRKQIVLLAVGIELFLFSFFTSGFLASYLVEQGMIQDFGLEQYGLFGMTIFMAFLAYLIVRFQAFNIKLIAAQALVISLVVLIGSQLFFVRNTTNKILTLSTLAISLGFGYMLIKSVKLEVKRKEELQDITAKLAMANDKLRELDNAKSEFISIASHQLRTPLTAVKGFVSLLLEGSYGRLVSKHREVLNKVYQSNERLIDLVEDLLNLSRIESGRMEYKYEKVKMEEICQEIYDTFFVRAKEKNLSLEVKSPEKFLPEITADKLKTREIISNLVDNALKYTPQGGVTVIMESADGLVRVKVKDTGIGVPKEEVPYLFGKFSRGKDTTRLTSGGSGIGLHVGRRMAEDMGGQLRVESEGDGKGSTFILELPIEHKE